MNFAIEELKDEIINQIAAGEVIENPAAVVKELFENSIDAGAQMIEIDLENSGFKRIMIKDDGHGIHKDYLVKAPLRHTTSKIRDFNDLYSINTMGFRGEALASIFSVAKTKIVSRYVDCNDAFEISSENLKEIKKSAHSQGTSIIVEDLFYNTPARKKYMKSANLEMKSILDIIRRFEIFYHDKKIIVKNNGKILVNKPAFKTVEENLYYVLGKELKGNIFSLASGIEGMKITGFIGNPSTLTYSFRKNQFIFVNRRFVKSKLLSDAIYEGFGTNLMENRHPFFVLIIDIDPEVIDVNVHPTKIEIRFEDEKSIFEFARSAVRSVFEKEEIFKPFEAAPKETDTSLDQSIDEIVGIHRPKVKEEKTYYSSDSQKVLEMENNNPKEERIQEHTNKRFEEFGETIEYGPLYDILKDYRIVGQVNKTFVILETPKEMIVVDQHVAEEKFFFEKFKENLESSGAKTQMLLKPEILSLSNQEFLLFEENKALLEKIGFKVEVFGNNEILVRGTPLMPKGEILSAELVKDILHEVTVDKRFSHLETEKVEKLASMSCKRSIKAGHELTTPEIKTMIENLKRLKEPFNCPHGRPILLQYKFSDLEKKFKRIV